MSKKRQLETCNEREGNKSMLATLPNSMFLFTNKCQTF